MSASAVRVVVFDVNETLSDMAPMADRFREVGADGSDAAIWFASVLRDGFALAAAGASARFRPIAEGVLRPLLSSRGLSVDLDAAVDHVLSGFMGLSLHPDVAEGVRALSEQGYRLVTLTNGSVEVADRLLGAAGIRDRFEQLLSVDDAGVWKPAAAAYAYAAGACGVSLAEMLLVAVHPWDVDGARRAGMQAAWVDRNGRGYPPYFTGADYVVGGVAELAERLGG